MNIEQRIEAFDQLGSVIRESLELNHENFEDIIGKAKAHNPWFDSRFTRLALGSLAKLLTKDQLTNWVGNYPKYFFQDSDKVVGTIMAGNIPLVGFHDFLSILISGKVFKGKLSNQDEFLLVFLADLLIKIEPRFKDKIEFIPHLLKDFDAVIATGSNNSSRYFDYYFGKYPHIIRSNRNSIAVLSGKETTEEMVALADDIYLYFGLGCRSISKIYVPKGYDMTKLLDCFNHYTFLSEHTKYFNNYEYNKSIFLINGIPHLDNGFCLFTKSESIASPISVVYYEEYDQLENVEQIIETLDSQIQCVIGGQGDRIKYNKYGDSQHPSLLEYADNVDVITFLGNV